MTTYVETIELENKVSGPAKDAQTSLADLGRGLDSVNKTLANTEQLSKKATQPLRGPGGKFLPKGGTAPMATPPVGAENLTAGMLASQGDITRGGKLSGGLNNLTAKMLRDQATPNLTQAMLREQGPVQPVNLTEQMLAQQKSAKGTAMPTFDSAKDGRMIFDSSSMEAAKLAAEQLKGSLAAAKTEMVRAAAMGDTEAYGAAVMSARQYAAALEKLPAPAKSAQDSSESLWTKAAHVAQVAQATIGESIAGIKSAFSSLSQGDVKGAIDGMTDALSGVAKMLDLVVPGLGQAVSLAIKLAGGFAGIAAGLIQEGMAFAIESSQAKQAMLGMFDAMGQGVVTGAELDEMLSGLADKTGITKDELSKLTQAFLQMGITSTEQLERMTLAAQSAIAIVGNPAAAQSFENLQKKIALAAETGQGLKIPAKRLGELYSMGLKVDDVAKKMGLSAAELSKQLADGSADASKFGKAMTDALIEKGEKPLQKLGSSVENIKKKFLQDIGDMFEDIDVAPLMAMVKDFFSLFSQASPVGQILKAGIQGFFTETFTIAQKLMPILKRTFILLVVGAMDAYAALAPTVEKIFNFLKTVMESVGGVDTMLSALKGLGIAVLAVGAVIGIFVGYLVAMSVLMGVIIGWVVDLAGYLVGPLFSAIGMVAGFFVTAFTAINDTVASIVQSVVATLQGWVDSAPQIAIDFVQGLIMGLLGGSGGLVGAVASLGSQAIQAAQSIFDSHSPSRVMMGIGGDVASGLAGGMEAGGPDVHGAASEMAGAAVAGVAQTPNPVLAVGAGGAAAAAGSSTNSSASSQITIAEGAIVIQGADKAGPELAEEILASLLERIAGMGGLSGAPA